MYRVLIVEDDADIAALEQDYLEVSGFKTEIVKDGESAVKKALTGRFDLILLDIMLPELDGFSVCETIRKELDLPILMVTAKHDSIYKIRGLGLGADDYIAKPFDPAELVARVKAHLSRYERLTSKNDSEIIDLGRLRIPKHGWKVYVEDEEIDLTNKEFELLLFLAQNPNVVFSKEQIFERIWGYDYINDSATVAVHINRLREKIEVDSKNPKYITTIRGAGYRFNKV